MPFRHRFQKLRPARAIAVMVLIKTRRRRKVWKMIVPYPEKSNERVRIT